MFGKKKHLLTFFVVFVVSWTMFAENAAASGGDEFVGGTIATKGPVLDENGKRIWVEYNAGRFANYVRASDGSRFDENSTVMAAEEYRACVDAFLDVQNEHGYDMEILTRAAYAEREFPNVEGQFVEKPALAEGTKSAVVRTVFYDDFLLLESPIDLNSIAQPGDGAKSLLLDENGRVIFESALQIGFLSAFYSVDESDIGSFCETSMKDYQKGHKLWAPVRGAEITSTNSAQKAWTDENGDFRISYVIPTCPGTSFPQTNQLLVKLRYGVFDPQRMDYSRVYYLKHEMRDECSGIGEGFFGFTMGGLMMRDSAASIERSMSEHKRGKANIAVDVAFLTGRGFLSNEGVSDSQYAGGQQRAKRQAGAQANGITVGDTTEYHDYERPEFLRSGPANPDIDAGGVYDTSGNPNADGYVRVWLHSVGVNPVLTRLGDFRPDFSDRGLLRQISRVDLEKTDIYVFRASDDEKIFDSTLRSDQVGENGILAYAFKIRGPADRVTEMKNRLGRINNVTPLKIGDDLKIVAVNRVTGYIGTVAAKFKSESNGNLTVKPAHAIRLRPPNLSITVRRRYKIEKGLTAGEKPEYMIGFEGSGMVDDEYIAIETDWKDWGGFVLPVNFDGFTGRLAVVSRKNYLEDYLAQFSIKPGRHTEVLKLPNTHVDDLHYYIHVSGFPVNSSPDFSTGPLPPSPEDILAYRPKNYAPVKVPIYDEAATARERNSLYTAMGDARQNLERLLHDPQVEPGALLNASLALNEATSNFKNAKPVHKYHYRPEMQFSLYDLDVSEILRTGEAGDAPSNILDDGTPVISPSDEIEIRYTIGHNILEPLSVLGPGRELVFSVGAEEVRAVINGNSPARFDELIHSLSFLEMEDYMTIRLVQNGDNANVLWDYAFLNPMHVRFKIVEEETTMTTEEYENESIYRTLGGVRLHLVCEADAHRAVTNYRWTKRGGKFFASYRSDARELDPQEYEGIERHDIYWESDPLANLNETITCEITFGDGTTLPVSSRIRSRELYRGERDPKGDDVKMLQSIMRMIGISQVIGKPGIAGKPVEVTGEFDEKTEHAAIYRLLKRDKLPEHTITDNGLKKIKAHWNDYLVAWENYTHWRKIGKAELLSLPSYITDAVNILSQTYSNAGMTANDQSVTVEQTLRAWIDEESGAYGHWGSRRYDYIVTLGGGDEEGSIGLSQICNYHKYGIKVQQSMKITNLYHPGEAIVGMARFSDDKGVGGGFRKAFVTHQYKKTYTSQANVFPRLKTNYTDDNRDLLSKALLAYNRGAGLKGMHNIVWPEALRENQPPPPGYTKWGLRTALKYSLSIQRRAGFHPREFTWVDKNIITTGADGICDTQKAGTDKQIIKKGWGLANQVCITPGADGTLNVDLNVNPGGDNDDKIVGDTVTTGPNGICESKKKIGSDDDQPIDFKKGKPDAVAITPGEKFALRSACDPNDDQPEYEVTLKEWGPGGWLDVTSWYDRRDSRTTIP